MTIFAAIMFILGFFGVNSLGGIAIVIYVILGLILGFNVGAVAVMILGCVGTVLLVITIVVDKMPGSSSGSASEDANDLFIDLNKGSVLTINDGYILDSNGYKLGSINGSSVSSRGKQIGTIKGNEIYSLNGTIICHIEGNHLVK